MIDVTIVATMRSCIVRQTVSSFKKYLFTDNLFKGKPPCVIINIDPVGPDPDVGNVLAAVKSYFPRIVSIRVPGEPSFPKAFKWVWAQTQADFVFHLEDDWELLRPVDLSSLIRILENEPDIASIRLPQFHAGLTHMKNWNKLFKWNGCYYVPPEKWLGFAGHPMLLNGEFVRKTAPLIDTSKNPEKQFAQMGQTPLKDEFDKWRYVVYGEPADPPTPPLIRDIGRQWIVESGWKKAGSKAFFTTWERVNA